MNTKKRLSLKPVYSGKASTAFWLAVNDGPSTSAAPGSTVIYEAVQDLRRKICEGKLDGEPYLLGCLLQDVESRILGLLTKTRRTGKVEA